MACKALHGLTFPQQRDEPEGSGSGWTTADGSMSFGDTIQIRSRIPVDDDGGTDCTGWLHYQYRRNGGAWTEWDQVKFAEPSLWDAAPANQKWYPKINYPTSSGTYEYRVWLEYDGSDYYSDIISVEVGGRWTEHVATTHGWTGAANTAGTWTQNTSPGGTWTETPNTAGTWTQASNTAGAWTVAARTAHTWSAPVALTHGWTVQAGTAGTWTEVAGTAGTWTQVANTAESWSPAARTTNAVTEVAPEG